MAKWIKNCQICNDGLCIRVEELKRDGLSVRTAAEVMHEEACEAYPELKNEFSTSKIRDRYRYHMKGKKLGEIPPHDSPFAGWPICQKCGSSRVKEKYHLHDSGEPLEPEEHGLCSECYREQLPKCKSCDSRFYENVPKHGLCSNCRKIELLKEKRRELSQELDKNQEEFDQIPIDADSEKFWNDVTQKIEAIFKIGGVPCGKVRPEILERINRVKSEMLMYFGSVIENSEPAGVPIK
jgi:hypothetical protein